MASDRPPTTPRPTVSPNHLPHPTPTTDFILIEAQKENIVPLSTGRSASILSSVFTKDKTETDRLVQEGHERYKKLVQETLRKESDGEELPDGVRDVLDPHYKSVYAAAVMHSTVTAHSRVC